MGEGSVDPGETLEEEQASRKRLVDSQVMGKHREGPDEGQASLWVSLVLEAHSRVGLAPCELSITGVCTSLM